MGSRKSLRGGDYAVGCGGIPKKILLSGEKLWISSVSLAEDSIPRIRNHHNRSYADDTKKCTKLRSAEQVQLAAHSGPLISERFHLRGTA